MKRNKEKKKRKHKLVMEKLNHVRKERGSKITEELWLRYSRAFSSTIISDGASEEILISIKHSINVSKSIEHENHSRKHLNSFFGQHCPLLKADFPSERFNVVKLLARSSLRNLRKTSSVKKNHGVYC